MAGVVGPFVGRTEEIGALVEIARSVQRDGLPGAALVLGDPGSGKSRLLSEACSRIELGPELRVTGYEPEQQVSLASASDLLRALSRVPEDGPRLDALVSRGLPTGGELDAIRVFEAAYRCLRRMVPALLVMDDLQWVDEQSQALVHFLLRGSTASGTPLALISAARPSPSAETFADALGHVLTSPDRFVRAALGPLPREDGMELVLAVAADVSPERAADIYAKAQGSPFWLGALALSGGAEQDAGRVLTSRLRGLPAEAASLLSVLVVTARPMTLVDLGSLLSWGAPRVAEAARHLVNRGVIVQEASTVRVAHDLIRWAALREVPIAEKTRIHRRLAAWLDSEAGDDVRVLLESMEHRRAAGMPSMDLALRLARSPTRRLLGSDGLRQLDEIADDNGSVAKALTLKSEVAALAVELGEWSLALERYATLSERLPNRLDRARAALEASRAEWELRRASGALFHLGRCRELNPADPLLTIECDAHEAGVLLWLENEREGARVPRSRAVAAARRMVKEGGVASLDRPARRAYLAALQAEFDGTLRDERFLELIGVLEEMSAAVLDDLSEECRVGLNLMLCLQALDLWREAETRFRRLRRAANLHLLPRAITEATFALAFVLADIGPLDEAYALAQEAAELAERIGAPERFTLPEVRSLQHAIAVSHIDWRRGLAGIAREAEADPDPHARMMRYLSIALWVARFEGEAAADRVAADLAAGRADMIAAGCDRCGGEFIVESAEALARIGELEAARSVLIGWDAKHPTPDASSIRRRQHAEALLAAQSDEPASSVPLYEDLLAKVHTIGLRLDEVWLGLDLGDTLARIDPKRAVRTLEETAALAEAIAARSELGRAEQMLRALGVRTWRRGRSREQSTTAALSDRELQIARLVVRGASNREIAEALFLSRKTVERHMSNILAKLGIRNRTELASTLARELRAER